MTDYSRPPQVPHTRLPFTGDVNIDHQARLALVEREAMERRLKQLGEQVALENSPELRVRAWERLHELSLPRKTAHPLLAVIARQTQLTTEQVRDEQRRRLMPARPAIDR